MRNACAIILHMTPRQGKSGNPATRAADERAIAAPAPTGAKARAQIRQEKGGAIALYHVMYAHETFDDIAEHLFQLVKHAAQDFPGQKRILYFDIDEHRNEAGGWDHDAFELQHSFVLSFLMPYLSEAHVPLMGVTNPRPQRDDLPDSLMITPGGPKADRETLLLRQAEATGLPVWDAEEFNFIQPDGSRTDRNGQPA
jgi:hypothetical protein